MHLQVNMNRIIYNEINKTHCKLRKVGYFRKFPVLMVQLYGAHERKIAMATTFAAELWNTSGPLFTKR